MVVVFGITFADLPMDNFRRGSAKRATLCILRESVPPSAAPDLLAEGSFVQQPRIRPPIRQDLPSRVALALPCSEADSQRDVHQQRTPIFPPVRACIHSLHVGGVKGRHTSPSAPHPGLSKGHVR